MEPFNPLDHVSKLQAHGSRSFYDHVTLLGFRVNNRDRKRAIAALAEALRPGGPLAHLAGNLVLAPHPARGQEMEWAKGLPTHDSIEEVSPAASEIAGELTMFEGDQWVLGDHTVNNIQSFKDTVAKLPAKRAAETVDAAKVFLQEAQAAREERDTALRAKDDAVAEKAKEVDVQRERAENFRELYLAQKAMQEQNAPLMQSIQQAITVLTKVVQQTIEMDQPGHSAPPISRGARSAQ